jgi:allophanate hydrolase subunit 2
MGGKVLSMIKYVFMASGKTDGNKPFIACCISYDIAKAVQMLNDKNFTVYSIEMMKQAKNDDEVGIQSIKTKW